MSYIQDSVQPIITVALDSLSAIPNSSDKNIIWDGILTQRDFPAITSAPVSTISFPIQGVYLVTWEVRFAPNSSGTQRATWCEFSEDLGGRHRGMVDVPPSTADIRLVSSCVLNVSSGGQSVIIYAWQDSGGSLNIGGTSPWEKMECTIARIGAAVL